MTPHATNNDATRTAAAPATRPALTAIVKGAGPSGLAASIALAQAGFSVRVVERRPARRVGEGRRNMVALRPEALRQLDLLGALDYGDADGDGRGPMAPTLTPMTAAATHNEWDGGTFVWPLDVQPRYPAPWERAGGGDGNKRDGGDSSGDGAGAGGAGERPVEGYVSPAKLSDQVPSTFVDLGHLEDHLAAAAAQFGVRIEYGTTFDLFRADDNGNDPNQDDKKDSNGEARKQEAEQYEVVVRPSSASQAESGEEEGEAEGVQNGQPQIQQRQREPYDLIVCASGKGDSTVARALGFRPRIGVLLDDSCLPAVEAGQRQLRLGPEHEVESQRYLVFGVVSPPPLSSSPSTNDDATAAAAATDFYPHADGTLSQVTRKAGTGTPEQPLVEIAMRHAATSHLILQLPRGLEEEEGTTTTKAVAAAVDAHATARANALRLAEGTAQGPFRSVADLRARRALVWGDPLAPITVETATAPQFAWGANVVLVGDAGFSCSPASGLGADLGLTHDGHAVRRLAADLVAAATAEMAAEEEKGRRERGKALQPGEAAAWHRALDRFNYAKAQGAVMWSQGSRYFYLSADRAAEILADVRATGTAAAASA